MSANANTTAPLGSLCEVITKGSSPNWQGFEYCDKGIPFVRSQNVGWGNLDLSEVAHLPEAFNLKEKKSVLRTDDVLLNLVGASIGRACIASSAVDGGNVNQAVAVIRVRKELLSPPYLKWFLISPSAQARIHSEKVDVARANFSLEDTRCLPIPVVSLPEQRRIVAEIEKQFTRLEAGVAALRRVRANLKRYRAAVLKAACEGKLAEGDRTRWKTERLGQLVTIRYGKMLPTKEFSESGFPVFGANGIIGRHTRYLYETEQVLISCRGAYSGKINLSPPKCYITSNSLVLELPECSRVEKRFLFYVLQAADKSKLVTGSAQPQVTINNADVLDVPVPPLAEQTRIVAEVERRLSVVEELESVVSANLQRATRLRQSILQKAFTGELA